MNGRMNDCVTLYTQSWTTGMDALLATRLVQAERRYAR
jgi:hypothetical protein